MMSYTQKIDRAIIPPDKRKSIYFAHPFDKWQTPREAQIEKILESRGYKVINPFREEDILNEKYGVTNYYENPTFEFAGDIVDKDYDMVFKCDAYFGWFPKGVTSIGTPIELVWAQRLDKEIIVLSYKPHPFLWMLTDIFYIGYKSFRDDVRFYDQTLQ